MRVKIAGAGEDMKAAFAEHEFSGPIPRPTDRVTFATSLRSGGGGVAIVTAPRLTPAQARAWIKRRMERFHAEDGARESREEAIRRKALAAQGEGFTRRLKATLTDPERMEADMMFSPHSHTAGRDLEAARRARDVVRLTVDAEGHVRGLPDHDMVDTEGRRLTAGRS